MQIWLLLLCRGTAFLLVERSCVLLNFAVQDIGFVQAFAGRWVFDAPLGFNYTLELSIGCLSTEHFGWIIQIHIFITCELLIPKHSCHRRCHSPTLISLQSWRLPRNIVFVTRLRSVTLRQWCSFLVYISASVIIALWITSWSDSLILVKLIVSVFLTLALCFVWIIILPSCA